MEEVLGSASMKRTNVLRFPNWSLVADDGTPNGRVLAELSRDSWFWIYFGRGRRIQRPDATRWRLTAVGSGTSIVPMVVTTTGKLAIAGALGQRSYGITGPDYGFKFFPVERTGLRTSAWTLREFDLELARFGPRTIEATRPVPLAAALLCFALIRYGIPGEANLGIPQFQWG